MVYKFEKLEIWRLAMDYGESIHSMTKKRFPQDEVFNLKSQICRAADSVALNIAEGSIGQTDREQSKFINYAIRSLAETVTCLFKARSRKYIDEDEFMQYYGFTHQLMRKMTAFKNGLEKKKLCEPQRNKLAILSVK